MRFLLGIKNPNPNLNIPLLQSNEAILELDAEFPISTLKLQPNIKHIQFVDYKFYCVVEFPEYVDVNALTQSKYSNICKLANKLVYHSNDIFLIMTLDEELKKDLINSLIVDERTREIEYKTLWDSMSELDSKLDEHENYLLCSSI